MAHGDVFYTIEWMNGKPQMYHEVSGGVSYIGIHGEQIEILTREQGRYPVFNAVTVRPNEPPSGRFRTREDAIAHQVMLLGKQAAEYARLADVVRSLEVSNPPCQPPTSSSPASPHREHPKAAPPA